MYEGPDNVYCYPNTSVLKNRHGAKNQADLDKFEIAMVKLRQKEPLPKGKLSYSHYRAIHRHLFQDVYGWAGRLRRVRITKGNSTFCYPENISREMKKLFAWLDAENYFRDLDSETFAARVTHFLAELNAIHPFREGNGRTQNIFLTILADRAGHPLDFERLNPPDMMQAMIASFGGDEKPLENLILVLMRVR
jgi:cell filamentation protein